MKKLILSVIAASISNYAIASATDTGEISRIYTNAQGHIAIQLNNGFPKATESNPCADSTGWAGLYDPNDTFKSLMLSAKNTNRDITVVTSGCEGEWFKIYSLTVD